MREGKLRIEHGQKTSVTELVTDPRIFVEQGLVTIVWGLPGHRVEVQFDADLLPRLPRGECSECEEMEARLEEMEATDLEGRLDGGRV